MFIFPFCSNICSYCDFTKVFYNSKFVEKYLEALIKEIKDNDIDKLDTIYFGGGTPSVLSKEEIAPLLSLVQSYLHSQSEFTLEMNVEQIDEDKLNFYKTMGVNRLSIGVQSFDDDVIKRINRHHDEKMVFEKIALAKKAGFTNISIDLIYGLPGQNFEIWKKDVQKAISLNVDHISSYSLAINPSCKFYVDGVKEISQDESRLYYDYLLDQLRKHGFERYEVSNFARNKKYSKHNLVYWNNQQYYGCGLSSCGYIDGYRIENTKSMSKYLKDGPCYIKEKLDDKMILEEFLLLKLRTMWGFTFAELLKISKDEFPRLKKNIDKLVKDGLLKVEGDAVSCTDEGFMLLDFILISLF